MNPTQNQPTTTGVDTPAQVLRAAALYLQRHGWSQGDYYAAVDSATRPACALGAICVVVRGACIELFASCSDTPAQRAAISRTADFLAGWLVNNDDTFPAYEQSDNDTLDLVVSDWNDDSDRTAADVVAGLRAAADDWDRQHPGGAR